MENKKNMNIVLAVVICLVLVGVLIFISINNKVNMATNNNALAQIIAGRYNTIPVNRSGGRSDNNRSGRHSRESGRYGFHELHRQFG